ncbi:MAG: hypothetical protein RLZZ200_2842 [Pseudomonadota bacterium]|jgi:two-component system response regulator
MNTVIAPELLIVDDDENDRSLIQRALRRLSPAVVAQELVDGESAIHFLLREQEFAALKEQPLPKLVLCDMKMPFRNGIEVIRAARGSQASATVPIVILSSSGHTRDIEEAMAAGANEYVIKPSTYGEFSRSVQETVQRWLGR